jgi:hypothetical protein
MVENGCKMMKASGWVGEWVFVDREGKGSRK